MDGCCADRALTECCQHRCAGDVSLLSVAHRRAGDVSNRDGMQKSTDLTFPALSPQAACGDHHNPHTNRKHRQTPYTDSQHTVTITSPTPTGNRQTSYTDSQHAVTITSPTPTTNTGSQQDTLPWRPARLAHRNTHDARAGPTQSYTHLTTPELHPPDHPRVTST